jgi:hypothetical protein
VKPNIAEHVTKASDCLVFACDDLAAAYAKSEGFAEIVLGDILRDAVELRDRINQARKAIGGNA